MQNNKLLAYAIMAAAVFLPGLIIAETMPLDAFARRYSMRAVYDKNTVTLTNRYHSLRFELNSRRAEYRGVSIWLNRPITMNRGRWMLDDANNASLLSPLLNPNRTLKSAGKQRILLDPGHGGEDQGASGRSRWSTEKRLNLDIALRVKALLDPSYDVYLTRASDQTLSLEKRVELASQLKADIFISIHLNASTSKDACGVETHVLTPQGFPSTAATSTVASDKIRYPGNAHDGPNAILGYLIQRNMLLHVNADDRGLRRSRFFVLRNATCPAALVECGFLSNRAEENRLLLIKHRDAIAKGISEGIIAYMAAAKRAGVIGK